MLFWVVLSMQANTIKQNQQHPVDARFEMKLMVQNHQTHISFPNSPPPKKNNNNNNNKNILKLMFSYYFFLIFFSYTHVS